MWINKIMWVIIKRKFNKLIKIDGEMIKIMKLLDKDFKRVIIYIYIYMDKDGKVKILKIDVIKN